MNTQISLDRDSGFSLMEMVIAVAIMLILGALGYIAYQQFTDNARQAAVENAASQVYTAARAYSLNPSSEKGPMDAQREYNGSNEDQNIIVTVTMLQDDRLRVTARFQGTDHIAIRESPGEDGGTWENSDGTLQPPTGTRNVNLTYQCPQDSTGYLGIVNIAPGTTVSMWEADNPSTLRAVTYQAPGSGFNLRQEAREEILRSRMVDRGDDPIAVNDHIIAMPANDPSVSPAAVVDNASEVITMRAGIEYHVNYDGQVETFAAPGNDAYGNVEGSLADCLTSIDHFGDNINLKNLTYLGGDNLVGLPDNLPSTVRSLRGAFENATNLNDPNIRTWDTSNVSIMQSTFYNASSFNQNISTWSDHGETYWDTSNVFNMRYMLSGTTAFNNGDTPGESNAPLRWNTENVRDIRQMFYNAVSFNQDLSSWNTAHIGDMNSTFRGATSFDQDLSGWNISSIRTSNNFTTNDVPIHGTNKLPRF